MMRRQNGAVPIAAWWCLVAAGIAACGVALGDFPVTSGSALLLVMIILVPTAIMLGLWRRGPDAAGSELLSGADRNLNRRSRG